MNNLESLKKKHHDLKNKIYYVPKLHLINQPYRKVISKDGHWLKALFDGDLKPISQKQIEFIESVKSIFNGSKKLSNFKDNIYIKAFVLMFGYDYAPETFDKRHLKTSEWSKLQTTLKTKEIQKMKSVLKNMNKPKKSTKPKLDPFQTKRIKDDRDDWKRIHRSY